MDKKSLLVCFIGLLLFIGVIVWINVNQQNLKQNGVLVSAKILRVNYGGKVSGGFQCAINYQNKYLKLPSPSTLKRGNFDFIGKNFPAMFLPTNETLEILINFFPSHTINYTSLPFIYRFFIGYWINSGLDFYLSPFFLPLPQG